MDEGAHNGKEISAHNISELFQSQLVPPDMLHSENQRRHERTARYWTKCKGNAMNGSSLLQKNIKSTWKIAGGMLRKLSIKLSEVLKRQKYVSQKC